MDFNQSKCHHCCSRRNSTAYRDFAYVSSDPQEGIPLILQRGMMPSPYEQNFTSTNNIRIQTDKDFTYIYLYAIGIYKVSFTITATIPTTVPTTIPLAIGASNAGRNGNIYSASGYNNLNRATLSFFTIERVPFNTNPPQGGRPIVEFTNYTNSNTILVDYISITVERLSNRV